MLNKQSNNVKVYFDTLGCAKNIVDTSKMEELLKNNFFLIVDNAQVADVIILNTCAFIEAASQESIDTFFEYRKLYPDKKIIVVGCLPSRYGSDLYKSLPEADAFLNCDEENKIVILLDNLFKNRNKFSVNKQNKKTVFSYVKISEGCNRCCSYCTIPSIRGKYRSLPYEDIKNDVKTEAKRGAKEIVLVAQDCGVWGSDFTDKKSLAWLLNNLSKDFSDINFRILYIQPDAVNDELLHLVAQRKNIYSYFDIPMQHCNKEILRAMNRRGDKQKFLNLISEIRKIVPDAIIRSTFIVGFPGESESDFDELCDFCEQAELDYAGCFEYSKEEGTKAADMDNQIEASEKFSRSNALRQILDDISIGKINSKIGNSYKVLIEGKEEGRYFGRAYFQAPEVDGQVYISEFEDTKNIHIGDCKNVKISDTEYYDLVGKIDGK